LAPCFRAVGIRRLTIIINDTSDDCRQWLRDHGGDFGLDMIVRTTPSSYASFQLVVGRGTWSRKSPGLRLPVRSSAKERDDANAELVAENGVQIAPLHYPNLGAMEIFESVETFYRHFCFRSNKIASIVGEMLSNPDMLKRRMRERSNSSAFCANAETLWKVGANLKRLNTWSSPPMILADAANEAAEMAHRNGIVTAASLMVGAPGADAALAIARRRPSLPVRMHGVLLEAKSVLSRADTPLLVDETGDFRKDMLRFGVDFRAALRRQIEAAFRLPSRPLRAPMARRRRAVAVSAVSAWLSRWRSPR
jgi:hypothetical protein